MFGPSFLGNRGNALIDIVILAIVVIIPVLIWSWRLARHRRWQQHKQVQLVLAILLGIVVLLFEIDLRAQGGIFVITAGSAYEGTATLAFWIWIHTAFAISAAIIWLLLVIVSLIKFPRAPVPAAFPTHKYFGRAGMIAMLGSSVTAVPMYVYGFVL